MKKTERLQLRVTAETKITLELLAAREKRSISNLIEYWTEEHWKEKAIKERMEK